MTSSTENAEAGRITEETSGASAEADRRAAQLRREGNGGGFDKLRQQKASRKAPNEAA